MPSALNFEFIIIIYSFIYLFWIYSGLAGSKCPDHWPCTSYSLFW